MTLYQDLLGADWDRLDAGLRRLHAQGTLRAKGTFRVRHGNWLARLFARLGGFPARGEAVRVELIVTPIEPGEEWRRSFAGRPMVSTQAKSPDGLLAEVMGRTEMRFRLEVVDGALHYHPAGAALRFGRLRLPLCRCCAPRVTASETPGCDGARIAVHVRLPLLGLLIAYEGSLTIEAQA